MAYYRARYYNSLTGRFLSRDPEAGKPADPKSLHKYLYAGGDPVNVKDPTGRDELLEVAYEDEKSVFAVGFYFYSIGKCEANGIAAIGNALQKAVDLNVTDGNFAATLLNQVLNCTLQASGVPVTLGDVKDSVIDQLYEAALKEILKR